MRTPNSRGAPTPSALSVVDLFAGLDDAKLKRIEQQCATMRYAAHEQIIDRCAPNTDAYIVLSGCVRVVNYSVSGREITFDDVETGGYFGEIAAIDGQPRSAGVMAMEDSQLMMVPRAVFLEVLETTPTIAMRVMRRLAKIVRAADERIMDLSTLAAHNRVHAEVLRQARAIAGACDVACLKPIPTHGDIASRVSTTRETVARALNDLAREGVVERTKDALLIHDMQRLEDLVEGVRG